MTPSHAHLYVCPLYMPPYIYPLFSLFVHTFPLFIYMPSFYMPSLYIYLLQLMALVVKQNDQMKKDFKARQTLQAPFQPAATTFDEKRRRYLVWNAVGSIICTEYSHTNSRIEIRFANVGGKNKQVGDPLALVLLQTLMHRHQRPRIHSLTPPHTHSRTHPHTHSLTHPRTHSRTPPLPPLQSTSSPSPSQTDCLSRQHGILDGSFVLRR